MKGLIYASAVRNKGWFIGSGAAAVLGTVLGVILLTLLSSDAEGISMESVILLFPLISSVILAEFPARDLERSLKCHFTDYAMAAGISKNAIVLTELVKNLLCSVTSMIAASIMMLCYNLAGAAYVFGDFVGMWEFILFMYLIEWAALPLVVNLKSAEQAGLIIGLIIGFGIVFPVVAFSAAISKGADMFGVFTKLLDSPAWIIFSATDIIYALFYILLLARVKRGDVC